ncbi:hypothetical protein BVY04_03030 [bacterium M21]|nr:hypothetical protein BVY04_03030 [bacterium M21]
MEPELHMLKKTILIVDDEVSALQTMKMVLSTQIQTVKTISSAREALAFIQESKTPLSLLITDIIMPSMGGAELIRGVQEVNSSLPILVITGYGNAVLFEKLKKCGVDHFLAKPFTPDELLSAVLAMLRADNKRKEAVVEPSTSAAALTCNKEGSDIR